MKVRLAARGVHLSEDLKQYVRRRLRFNLGRFAGKINSVSLRLADVNGPRGGVDKCCDLRIDAGLRRHVIVRERRETIHAAVAFAALRAERAVRRQLSLARPAARRDNSARNMRLEQEERN